MEVGPSSAESAEADQPALERIGAELRYPPRFATRPESVDALDPVPTKRDPVRVALAGAVVLPVCVWVGIALLIAFGETLPLLGFYMLMVSVPAVLIARWVVWENWSDRHR